MTLLSAACNEVFHATGDAATDGPPTGCKAMPSLCTGTTPACDMVADKCVECTVASHDLCTGAEPVCGTEQACRGCTAHSECASEVCLPDGSCAAEGDVAYVSGAGSGTACTKAAPCKTITVAAGTNKAIVKAKGAVIEPTGLVLSAKNLRIFADNGASVSRSSAGAVIELATATTLEINELAVIDGLGTNGTGILLAASGSNNQLTLNHATVRGCGGVGVKSDGGTVTLIGSTVSGNTGGGITTNGGVVKLTNNFILRNGNASTAGVGGVSLTSAGAGSLVDFNTIVDNDASAAGFGGIACIGSVVVATNSILAGNRQNGASTMASQLFGCTAQTSAVLMSTAALKFKNDTVVPYDYHLLNGSIAIDTATTATATATDVDGDARPQGAAKDQGADEYKP